MIIGEADYKVIHQVLDTLAAGAKRVDIEAVDRKVSGYFVGPNQIRLDIVENKK